MAIVKKVSRLGARPGFGAATPKPSSLRPEFVEKIPPCSARCPNGTDIRRLLMTLAQGELRGRSPEESFADAFYVLAERNPLPSGVSRLCPHRCEAACNRQRLDEPLAISAIERAVGDYYAKQARTPVGGLQPPAGAYDGDWRVNEPAVIDRVIAEARRCMSCGQCFECDNCWECCSPQAVVKPSARGEPYRFRLELCPGCGACADECPSGYIDMR